jgi:magnesium transporter
MGKRRSAHQVKKSRKIGLAPGHLVFLGDTKTEEISIRLMDYSEKGIVDKQIKNLQNLAPCKTSQNVSWVDIVGLHETDLIDQIGKMFDIHSLTLEDILNTDQRPKVDFFDHYIYLVTKMITYNHKENHIEYEQISLILGRGFVLSFQERDGDVFNPIRERIITGKGRIRGMGADYLAYSLLDIIIDNYFLIMEKMGEVIEEYEESLVINPRSEWLNEVYSLKREILYLRRSIWPLREVITKLDRDESNLIDEKTGIFIRDLYDHTIQVIESIEIYRDMISGLLDLYLSSVSNRMNEVIKVLTIISTIFIPLTFIVGVYGMNFDNMPELHWQYGYFFIWAIMIALGVSMFILFKQRKWL